MTIVWIVISVAAFLLLFFISTIASQLFGRGYLGNENLSRDHYFDEIVARIIGRWF